MIIQIKNLIGEHCITAEQGKKLKKIIKPHILNNKTIYVDLTNVKTICALFINNAISPLLKNINRRQLDKLLHFTNTTDNQQLIIKLTLDNAENYHNNPSFKKAVNKVMKKRFKESNT